MTKNTIEAIQQDKGKTFTFLTKYLASNTYFFNRLEAVQKEQEELARQRLQARRQNRNKRSATPLVQLDIPMPDDNTDLNGMQEAVLREIEQGQTEERDMLLTVCIDLLFKILISN